MLERTQIFVDTSYLLASFYNSWEIGARSQLEIDLPEVVTTLGNMVSQQLGQPVHRQLWYDGIPESGPHRYQRALRTCDGVQLRAGQLIEWGERRTQKAVDTRLVADMVLTGVRREVSDIVIVSGDADMIPGVQEAVNAGVRVHLYGFGWDSMSSALRHACDSTTILDPREDFAECMQLEILEGPLPPVIRQKPEEACAQHQTNDPAHNDTIQGNHGDTDEAIDVHVAQLFDEEDKEALNDVHSEAKSAGLTEPETKKPQVIVDKAREDSTPTAQHTDPHVTQPEDSAAQTSETTNSDESAHHTTNNARTIKVTSRVEESLEVEISDSTSTSPNNAADAEDKATQDKPAPTPGTVPTPRAVPNPSMMAPRRKLRSRYVPLPSEVWSSSGYQTPFDVGQQYAVWWYDNAASTAQRDSAHMLSGGGLPPEIDRPLLQFACETLHEYTLTETQRVNLRDGFHSGIRGILLRNSQ
ncbi:NYN domain-containing protein [Corynebacterium sp. sy017]|uniref:NYN domain-containing protein n=1 Tax=Corynebacterium sp. sy017 TaxID=2499527 RepID=UPI001186A2CC|nr:MULTISPECIES: NYN domain-containing protein [unclassified Corynebacterium]MBP3088208.1 NYN domain-containing protein [Corynebacterium sp. sy017]TSD91542.1 NYN domain-containing protein [Corynebacterium sp. SY003]